MILLLSTHKIIYERWRNKALARNDTLRELVAHQDRDFKNPKTKLFYFHITVKALTIMNSITYIDIIWYREIIQNVNQMIKLIYSTQEQNLHVVYPIEFFGDNYECRNNRSLSPLHWRLKHWANSTQIKDYSVSNTVKLMMLNTSLGFKYSSSWPIYVLIGYCCTY